MERVITQDVRTQDTRERRKTQDTRRKTHDPLTQRSPTQRTSKATQRNATYCNATWRRRTVRPTSDVTWNRNVAPPDGARGERKRGRQNMIFCLPLSFSGERAGNGRRVQVGSGGHQNPRARAQAHTHVWVPRAPSGFYVAVERRSGGPPGWSHNTLIPS